MHHPIPYAPATDHGLLADLQRGEARALDEWYGRHGAFVRACCRRQVGDSDADDATQAVFLVLHAKPAEAARSPTLATWLYRVAVNVCNNQRRARARRARVEQEAMSMNAANQVADTRSDPTPALDEALAELPQSQRDAIVLRFLRDVDDAAAAAALGCSPATLRVRISRGLERLRTTLQRRGVVMTAAGLSAFLAAQAAAADGPAPAGVPSPTAQQLASNAIAQAAVRRAGRSCLIGGAAVATLVLAWVLLSSPSPAAPAAAASTAATSPPVGEDPARFIPADATFYGVYHDLQRTAARYAVSPFGPLSASPAGNRLCRFYGPSLEIILEAGEPTIPGYMPGLPFRELVDAGTRRVAWCTIVPSPSAPENVTHENESLPELLALEAGGDTAAIERRLRATKRRLTKIGDQLVASSLPQIDAEPRAPSAAVYLDVDADEESVQHRVTPVDAGIVRSVRTISRIEENGLRTRVLEQAIDADPRATWRMHPVDLGVLESLPEDTVIAMARSFDGHEIVLPR